MASVMPDPPTRQLLRHDHCFWPNGRQNFFLSSIFFCCLVAKANFPNEKNFLLYLRHIYQLENKTPSNIKKWKPFFSLMNLVS